MNELIVKPIPVKDIQFDKHNPRGLTPSQIEKDLDGLINSIRDIGVLVPIIIKNNGSDNSYTLVDGERRLRAALKANLKTIPASIAPNETDGRIMAFNVHMLHKDWTIAAETIAIKRIIDQIKKDEPSIKNLDLKRRIQQLTGYKGKRLTDVLNVSKFEDKHIKLSITGDIKESYLVRIEPDFVAKIKRKFPNILKVYNENKIREIMVYKAQHNLLVNTRYMMDSFKDVFNDPERKSAIQELLILFIHDKNKDIREVYEEWCNLQISKEVVEQSSNNTSGSVKDETNKASLNDKANCESTLDSSVEKGELSNKSETNKKTVPVDTNQNLTYAPIKLTKQQETKIEDIKPKYQSIGKEFSIEEKEYIKEAIHCLKIHCFKAAVLMIWATGISRILNFIERDILDFNNICLELKRETTGGYKEIKSKFKGDYQTIKTIRNNAGDRQLLFYIEKKGIIKNTELKKLLAHYNTRCDCAHPTNIVLKPSETIAVFENVFELILNNKKLK